jgi:acetylglutamate kinase
VAIASPTHAPIVVKLGGEVVEGGALARLAHDIEALVGGGARVIVTHGGGPQVSALSRRLGIEPRLVAGRRATDDATLDVVKMTLAGQVNVDLCARLRAAGLRPVGVHDAVRARRRPSMVLEGGGPQPVDLGHVGDPVGFDLALLQTLCDGGWLPVVACIGHDDQGAVYNINADRVANQLAGALKAQALLLVTSAPGVLTNMNDPRTRVARLTLAEARRLIAEGRVAGGMVVKLEESFAAIELGAQSIYILSGDVRRALAEPGSVGTLLVP